MLTLCYKFTAEWQQRVSKICQHLTKSRAKVWWRIFSTYWRPFYWQVQIISIFLLNFDRYCLCLLQPSSSMFFISGFRESVDYRDAITVFLLLTYYISRMPGLPVLYSKHHLSYDDCLEDKRENYRNCSMLCCVRHLCPVIRTHIWAVRKDECWFSFNF